MKNKQNINRSKDDYDGDWYGLTGPEATLGRTVKSGQNKRF